MAKVTLLEEILAIRAIFQRLCMSDGQLVLQSGTRSASFQILAENAEELVVAMAPHLVQTWGLSQGGKLSLHFLDRGQKWEAVTESLGPGQLEGLDTLRLAMPRSLRRTNPERFVDLTLEKPTKCTFSSFRNDLLDGQIRGFGEEGLELASSEPGKLRSVLRLGMESTLDMSPDPDLHLVVSATVSYVDEDCVGLRFAKGNDKAALGKYQDWLREQQLLQAQKDREDFDPDRSYDPSARKKAGGAAVKLNLVVDRDPLILVLSENENFVQRLGQALGRKFGILGHDYLRGPLRPLLKEYGSEQEDGGRIRLVLIHNEVRHNSPFEMAKRFREQEACPWPILVAGTEEYADKKRLRATESGALDYLVVEPFKVLQVLHRIDHALQGGAP